MYQSKSHTRLCALYCASWTAPVSGYTHNSEIILKKKCFPLETGSLVERGNAHVGLVELKLSSWPSLRICANYLMFVRFGSVTGTNPEPQSLPPPRSHSAWRILSTECQAWVTSVTERGWLSRDGRD